MARIEFIGSNLFIGIDTHVYPSKLGYWIDKTFDRGMRTDSRITVMDDFGNLIDVLDAAHQRAAYRQALH